MERDTLFNEDEEESSSLILEGGKNFKNLKQHDEIKEEDEDEMTENYEEGGGQDFLPQQQISTLAVSNK